LGDVTAATRFLDGGLLAVSASQGTPVYEPDSHRPPDAPEHGGTAGDHKPPLPTQPFSAAQLAALAANPDLVP
jgi:hypothetical protein